MDGETYVNPVMTSMSVLFPAPEGPIIAVNSPARNSPFKLSRISFVSETTEKCGYHQRNEKDVK